MRNVGWGFGLVMGGMLGIVACSDDPAPNTRDNAGAAAGAGGQAEPTRSDDCKQEPDCASGECVSHATCAEWGANFDCPATLDDVEASCQFTEITIKRYASDCGGTLVDASNGIQESRWTFDASGKLIGADSIGDVGDCDYWGTRCQPIGDAESFCAAAGAGGAGAGAEGGAGGVSAGGASAGGAN